MRAPTKTGLVLSGGGTRGAYEVGVISGIIESLGGGPVKAPLFSVLAGTSVGGINAAWLAAHAHRADLGVHALAKVWRDLELRTHLRLDLEGFFGKDANGGQLSAARFGHYLLDPGPLEALVRGQIPWQRLHDNIHRGRLDALVVAALHIGSGRTTMFWELAPGRDIHPSQDPRRRAFAEQITPDHVLASAAIPMLFPARRVGDAYYCDGGLRHNTPISPAIRAGAERLVVISLMHDPGDRTDDEDAFPHPAFLMGKMLNALLLDPVVYDLHVLDRFNRLLTQLEEKLDPLALAEVQSLLLETRGASYRRIPALVFSPSQDIGEMAGHHLRTLLPRCGLAPLRRWLLGDSAHREGPWESDLASYLLFDGRFAARLIALGLADARARSEEIRTFFRESLDAPDGES